MEFYFVFSVGTLSEADLSLLLCRTPKTGFLMMWLNYFSFSSARVQGIPQHIILPSKQVDYQWLGGQTC